MVEKICMHYFVTGRVQGVWFRAATQEEAQKLGVMGWVRNLPDGRVEVLACGEKTAIEKLHTWLQHGPRLAQVTDLMSEELPWQTYTGFAVI